MAGSVLATPALSGETPFDQLIVVYNEFASHPEKIASYRDLLTSTYGNQIIEVTTERDPKDTFDKIQNAAPDGRVRIASLTGDGPADDLAVRLAGSDIPLAVLPGGGANDLHYSFWEPHTHPLTVVEGHGITQIRPVQANTVTPEGKTLQHRSGTYLTLGSSALGAEFLNSRYMRAHADEFAPVHDARTLLYLLTHGKRFRLHNTVSGESEYLLDKIFPAIPRMAKEITWPHVTATDEQLHIYTVGGRTPKAAAMLALKFGLVRHNEVPADYEVRYRLGKRPSEGIWIQHGGEATLVPAQSTVSVHREITPYNLVTSQ
jgi:hypothetical protein